jgi:hypothetical protein
MHNQTIAKVWLQPVNANPISPKAEPKCPIELHNLLVFLADILPDCINQSATIPIGIENSVISR